jgi:predicted RNase H-like HicB family nuclease
MQLQIEIEREDDGRFLAEIPALPGVMAYGLSREEAVTRVKVLALRVIADEIEHGERSPEAADTTFAVAA